MFEKQDLVTLENSKDLPVYAHALPDMTTVKDFEQILESFIRETESGTNKYPLDLSNQSDLQRQSQTPLILNHNQSSTGNNVAAPNPRTVAAAIETKMEFAEQDNQTEVDSFTVMPIEVKFEGLQTYIQQVYTKISTVMQKSNNDAETVFNLMEEGYDRRYLNLVYQGKVYGWAFLHYDQTTLSGHRCYIRHISTIQMRHFELALDAIVKYCWQEMECNDIRMEIYHIKDVETGEQAADPEFKAAVAKFRFRWKTLSNDPVSGKRAQIMQAARQGDKIERSEPFSVKLALVLTLSSSEIAKSEKEQIIQIDAPIQQLNLGLHVIKTSSSELIASRKLTSDIDTTLTS